MAMESKIREIILMILYLAGNFPALSRKDKEQEFVDFIRDYGVPYNRLITYYYPHKCKHVLAINGEIKKTTDYQNDDIIVKRNTLQLKRRKHEHR